MTTDRFSLEYVTEQEPELVKLWEQLVLCRWERFLRTHDFDYYKRPGRSFSYPLLRPDDLAYFMKWDGACFSWITAVSNFVEQLIGEDIRNHDLNLAWMETVVQGNDIISSLHIFDAAHDDNHHHFVAPYVI